MITKAIQLSLFICLVTAGSAFGQQATEKHQSSKYCVILTIAGAGGGFALGVFGGIAAYDDAINASRKITTMAVLTGVAGGVGGYFLGRTLDHRSSRTTWAPQYIPDELDRSLMRARWASAGHAGSFAPHSFQPAFAQIQSMQADCNVTRLHVRRTENALRR